jgi:hypothetical protein
MPAKLSRADFAAALRSAGLAVSEAQIDDVHANAWPSMEALLDRLRAVDRPPSAEPAHVFRADAFKPEGV